MKHMELEPLHLVLNIRGEETLTNLYTIPLSTVRKPSSCDAGGPKEPIKPERRIRHSGITSPKWDTDFCPNSSIVIRRIKIYLS